MELNWILDWLAAIITRCIVLYYLCVRVFFVPSDCIVIDLICFEEEFFLFSFCIMRDRTISTIVYLPILSKNKVLYPKSCVVFIQLWCFLRTTCTFLFPSSVVIHQTNYGMHQFFIASLFLLITSRLRSMCVSTVGSSQKESTTHIIACGNRRILF